MMFKLMHHLMEANMEGSKNKRFIPIWLIIVGILITLGVALTEYYLSSSANSNFSFENFGGTFKVLTFFVAIIAIKLTVERMQQTKIQTEAMIDNLKFNNFFKHREEFSSYLSKKRYLQVIASGAKVRTENFIMDLYEFFFYRSYSDFKSTPNEDALLNSKRFITQLTSSILNNKLVDLRPLKREEFDNIIPTEIFNQSSIVAFVNNRIREQNHKFENYNEVVADEQRFKVFCVIQACFACILIYDVLFFCGQQKGVEIENSAGFFINVQTFLKDLKIDIDVIGA